MKKNNNKKNLSYLFQRWVSGTSDNGLFVSCNHEGSGISRLLSKVCIFYFSSGPSMDGLEWALVMCVTPTVHFSNLQSFAPLSGGL
jgi:hypothetical protein